MVAATHLVQSGLLNDLQGDLEREYFEAFIGAAVTGAKGAQLMAIANKVIALREMCGAVNALQQGVLFDKSTGEVLEHARG
jgi:hypothetical protein